MRGLAEAAADLAVTRQGRRPGENRSLRPPPALWPPPFSDRVLGTYREASAPDSGKPTGSAPPPSPAPSPWPQAPGHDRLRRPHREVGARVGAAS